MKQTIEKLLSGDKRTAARTISLIENEDETRSELLSNIFPHTGRAYLIGITGSPGSGKSSLVDRLIKLIRSKGLKLGVIAVDPTSPFTGGAILGDRIRMQEHALDKEVFIRSMGSRGSLGGLSRATREAAHVLDAMGKDVIIIETVGVGQSEIDIVKMADSTVVVLTPAGGDGVQTIKAGIMEIADIFAINKSDLDGADRTRMEINVMLDMSDIEGSWRPPIVKTMAVKNEGVEELYKEIIKHREFVTESGDFQAKRKERIKTDVISLIEYKIKTRVWEQLTGQDKFDKLVNQIMRRVTDPYTAADEILSSLNFDS